MMDQINSVLETNYQYQDLYNHNLAVSFGISIKQLVEILKNYETDNVLLNLPEVPGSIEALTLLTPKYNIEIITGRKDGLRNVTEEWIMKRLPFVSKIHFGLGRNNPLAGVGDRLSKARIAEGIHALCLVEDNDQELIYWDSDSVEPICFSQPWNIGLIESNPDIVRLDWPGIVDKYLNK